MSAAAVQPERILRELAALWTTLGRGAAGGENTEGVLRACSMTLIVAASGEEDAVEIGENVAALMREHPSRAIVLRVFDSEEPRLASNVSAQCWTPFGRRQQICCEQIEIAASWPRLEGAASALLALTVPDLPVVLWLRTPDLLPRPDFAPVLRLGRTVILDSGASPEPAAALEKIREAADRGWRVRDLAWTRLTALRERLARKFEDPSTQARIGDFRELALVWSGEALPSEALYLAGWIQTLLPGLDVRLERAPGSQQWVRSLTLRGAGIEIGVVREEAVVLEPPTDYDLVREEMAILGRDPAFERALAEAVRLVRQVR